MSDKLMLAIEIGGGAILIIAFFIIGLIVNSAAFLAHSHYESERYPERKKDPWLLNDSWGMEYKYRMAEAMADLLVRTPRPSSKPKIENARKRFLRHRRHWRLYWIGLIAIAGVLFYFW